MILSFIMKKLLHILFELLGDTFLGSFRPKVCGPSCHADFQLDHCQLRHRLE